jgi:hypothetical protein
MQKFEIVYMIADWYDGARKGVAGMHGRPHYFENCWDKEKQYWTDVFLLRLLDEETFALALEDWSIWRRWEQAFEEGKTAHDTHPCLPEDRARHLELEAVLSKRLVTAIDNDVLGTAEFVYGEVARVKRSVSG